MLRGYSRYGLGGLSLLLAAALLAAGPAAAAGFSIFEAGSRSTAMGGAFVAQADDLSAMFYNPAGLGEAGREGEAQGDGGRHAHHPDVQARGGLQPLPRPGYSAEMYDSVFFPPNLYASYGLSECVSLSFGTWFPFGLATRWDDPDNFRGRFISQYVDLKQYAAGLQVAWQINDYLAVGAGPELRFSDVKLQRKVPLFNPFTNRVVDAAHADIRGGPQRSTSPSARASRSPRRPTLSIGASYHGAVDANFEGDGDLLPASAPATPSSTPPFAAKIPVNKPVPVKTTIQFPGVTQVGIAYDFGKVTVAGRRHVHRVVGLRHDRPRVRAGRRQAGPDEHVLPHDWEDAWAYRFGVKWQTSDTLRPDGRLRLRPDARARRRRRPAPPRREPHAATPSASAGRWGRRRWIDFSNLFLFFSERTITTNDDNFNGRYKNFANLTVLNLRTSF